MQYRSHCGTLSESMKTTVTVHTRAELKDHIEKAAGATIISLDFKYACFDERIKWDTYYVVVLTEGAAVPYIAGMSDGKLEEDVIDVYNKMGAIGPVIKCWDHLTHILWSLGTIYIAIALGDVRAARECYLWLVIHLKYKGTCIQRGRFSWSNFRRSWLGAIITTLILYIILKFVLHLSNIIHSFIV